MKPLILDDLIPLEEYAGRRRVSSIPIASISTAIAAFASVRFSSVSKIDKPCGSASRKSCASPASRTPNA